MGASQLNYLPLSAMVGLQSIISSIKSQTSPQLKNLPSVSVELLERRHEEGGSFHHYLIIYPARAGPRAESARAVTGRRCPHSGVGRDFLARNGPNRTKTGVTRQRSEQFGRAQRLNGANAEGYKRFVDKNRGPISKNGFLGRNPDFWAQKRSSTFYA